MNIGTIVELIESMLKSTTMSNNEGAYGAGMAGAPFDPIAFIKKPQVILRIVGIVFAIIVFASIACEDLYEKGTCPMNNDPNACGFGITIGVIAFLALIVFLIIDARFDSFSSVKIRRRMVIADLAFSGVWGFAWFFGFCYMANEWRKTSDELEEKSDAGLIRLALAFSFFSFLVWAMICLLNYLRYRQGVSNIFNDGYEDPNQMSSGGGQNNMAGGMAGDNYRQAPFNTGNLNQGGGYQPNY